MSFNTFSTFFGLYCNCNKQLCLQCLQLARVMIVAVFIVAECCVQRTTNDERPPMSTTKKIITKLISFQFKKI